MADKTTSNVQDRKIQLVKLLIEINCLKFGEFTLKSGLTSPYYIDLREITMYPAVLKNIVKLIKDVIQEEQGKQQHGDNSPPVAIVGVPYGVVPVASAVAYDCQLSYYPVRKETKEYGHKTDTCAYDNFEYILVEDVMSTGSSIVDTIKKMDGKKITDAIVIVDRDLGGEANIQTHYPHIKLHSIIKASEILQLKAASDWTKQTIL